MSKRRSHVVGFAAILVVLVQASLVTAKGARWLTMVEPLPQGREVAGMELPASTLVEYAWIEELQDDDVAWSSRYLTRVTVFEHAAICGAELPPGTSVRFAQSVWSLDQPHRGDDGRLMFWTPATDVEIAGVVVLEGVEVVLRCAPDPGQHRIYRGTLAAPGTYGALGLPAGSEVTWITEGGLQVRFAGWARSHGIAVPAYSQALVYPGGRFRSVTLGGDAGTLEIAGVTCLVEGHGQGAIDLHPSGLVRRCVLSAALVVDDRTIEVCTPVELAPDGSLVGVEPRLLIGCDQR